MTSSFNKRKCINIHCGGNKIVAKDGGSCIPCSNGTKANRSKTECMLERRACAYNQIISKRGCSDCPDYMLATKDNRMCTNPKCTAMEIVTQEGRCQRCPAQTTPNAVQRECMPIVAIQVDLEEENQCEDFMDKSDSLR